MNYRALIGRLPAIGSLAIFLYRCIIVLREFTKSTVILLRWLVMSRETNNFTYDLSPLNKAHLASFVASVTETSYSDVVRYFAELDSDTDLQEHVRRASQERPQHRAVDATVLLGRRLGWYAITRALKPETIVETGVDQGLGSCVLTAALMRNAAEGHPGRYYGLDINPTAGYLLTGRYREFGEIHYGDSISCLRTLNFRIDLFINDSDHSAAYEAAEYRTIADRLGPATVIVGDNAHFTDELLKFSLLTDREFLFFSERPIGHWYPGAGIGVSFRRRHGD